MGDLKDMVDVIKSAVEGSPITKERIMRAKPNSLARMASEGTLQFPVLVSASLDIDTAQNISKALERNYTTFVQTALSLKPSMLVGSDGANAARYIKDFHQNMNSSNISSYDLLANIVEGYHEFLSDENIVYESAIYNSSTRTLNARNKDQIIDLLESVRHDILNNKYIPKAEITYNFSNPDLNKKYNSLTEADHRTRQDAANYKLNKDKFDYQKDRDIAKDKSDLDKFNYQRQRDYLGDMRNINKDQFDKEKFEYQKLKDENDKYHKHDDTELFRNVLVDNDVKKANELIATTLHIKVKLFDSDGKDAGVVDFIIGIKCIMHIVKSAEMISNLVGACTNNDKVFNFFRWTTGEISFFKDFLFNISEIKHDVSERRSGASGWWLSLKKRRILAQSKRSMLANNQLLPNATIVVNAEEAEYIKTQYGYDLYSPLFINKIIDQYYLLGFVIVDNSTQVAHFMFENDRNNYQTVTFSALEKAGANDERKFKEMLKAVNRF